MAVKKTKTQAELRREKEAQNRVLRERYDAQKKIVVSKEEENFKSLYVVQTHDGWYKMFGHSAVFYAFDIGPKLGKQPRLLADSDFRSKENWGVVTVQSLEKLKSWLKPLNITCRYDQDGLAMFTLPQEYTEDDLMNMQHREELRWQAANKLIVPKEVFPLVYKEIRETTEILYEMVRKFVPTSKELVGDNILHELGWLQTNFVMMANGWGDERAEEYLSKAQDSVYRLRAMMSLVENLKLTDAGNAYKIVMKLTRLGKKIDDAILKKKRG